MFEQRIKGCHGKHVEMVTFDCHTIMALFNNRKLLNGLLSTVGVTDEGQKLGVLR